MTGQHLLSFRRSHLGAICALVSLRSQKLLLLPHHLPLPLFPCDTPAMSWFHTRIPDFQERPRADPLVAFIPNGRCVRLERARKFSWLYTTAFPRLWSENHPWTPFQHKHQHNAAKARPCQSTKDILGIKSPSSFFLWVLQGFLAEGTEAANCVVWAAFKWKTPAAENVAL